MGKRATSFVKPNEFSTTTNQKVLKGRPRAIISPSESRKLISVIIGKMCKKVFKLVFPSTEGMSLDKTWQTFVESFARYGEDAIVTSRDISRFESLNSQGIKDAVTEQFKRRFNDTCHPLGNALQSLNIDWSDYFRGFWSTQPEVKIELSNTRGQQANYYQTLQSSTGSGDPFATILNSLFNYIHMGAAVMMYRAQQNLEEVNPYELFTHYDHGVPQYRSITLFVFGDDQS